MTGSVSASQTTFRGWWCQVYNCRNVLVRSILLIPGIVAATFTTKIYNKLFSLKHHYGYRASLAGAVEGFKTQAPTHGDDIAAVAFYQLGRNPAEAIKPDADAPAWYEKLMAIIERFGDRFGKQEIKAKGE